METTFDLLVPFGMSCAAAMQMRQRGLRQASYPLDWQAITVDDALDRTLKQMETHFATWLLRENISFLPLRPENKNHRSIYDEGTAREFPHDFTTEPLQEEEYQAITSRYRRRIERLYADIQASARVCFVIAGTATQLTPELLRCAQERLAALFPQQKIAIFAVVYKADTFGEKVISDDILCFMTPRALGFYDMERSPYEWAWLDTVTLTQRIKPAGVPTSGTVHCRYTWKTKMIYKLYKHFKKKADKYGLTRTIFEN